MQLLQRVSRRLPDLEAATAQLCRPVAGTQEAQRVTATADGNTGKPADAAGPTGQGGMHRERLTATLNRFSAGAAGSSGLGERTRHVNDLKPPDLAQCRHQ